MFWREHPRVDLPAGDHKLYVAPGMDDLPDFPQPSRLDTLVGFSDASHATCLETRRSVTGTIFMLAGGCIAYKSKLQPTVSTSSTEAELMAAVYTAKMAKYFRSVLSELGYPQDDPTVLHVDNQASIAIVQQDRPTERTRHVDIAWFAIQEWRKNRDVILQYIKTDINVSDAGTKALGWILHSRHVRRAMGHCGSPLR